MSEKEFVNGAIILSISGILVKVLGFAFRIPLGRMIGAGGMGDYAPAYDVYAFILVIATAGIPVAISKLVAEERAVGRIAAAENVFRTSQIIMLIIGVSGFFILFFGADHIAALFNMKSSALAIKVIAPTLIFAPIMASYRGYFQGFQNMKPTGVSQTVEQFFRVVFGLAFAYLLYRNIIFSDDSGFVTENTFQSRGAAGACFGATVGAVFGLIIILIIYKKEKPTGRHKNLTAGTGNTDSRREIGKKVILIALPITIAACIMPIVNLADVAIVMRRLTEAGFEYSSAKSMFGELTGFAAPIMGLPQILIQAVVVGLVPLIAEANKAGEIERLQSNISLGYRTSIIITMPCAAGMFAIAEPVLTLFYGDQVVNAVPCLKIYAFAFVFLSVTSVTTAMLQGIGKQNIPLVNLIIGLLGKVAATWFLSGIVIINVKGAAIGTAIAYFVAAGLDIVALKKLTGIRFSVIKLIMKTLLASVVMGAIVMIVYNVLMNIYESMLLSTMIAIMCGVVSYVIMAVKFRMFTDEELKLIPGAKRLKGAFKM